MFVQPVLKMDQGSWSASHAAAFEFFGGVPARLVCDNLKTGVERPDLHDPQINVADGEVHPPASHLVREIPFRPIGLAPRMLGPMRAVDRISASLPI